MPTTTLPSHLWRLADIVIPERGDARRVTLHRIEGAPGQAVVMFAGSATEYRFPLDHVEQVHRES